MPSAWRQGDLIAPDDAVKLGMIKPTQRDTHRVLVFSHSCDVANSEDVEPNVEVMIGIIVQENEATSQNGHSIRTLHLGATGEQTTEWAQYRITDRVEIKKAVMLNCQPWAERRCSTEQRATLRRWLAQRYSRSEFPDDFITWLNDSGVDNRFEKLGKQYSASLVGIYFDLNNDDERGDPNMPYELGISLVYDVSNTDNEAAAQKAQEKLKALFTSRCKIDERWKWIELIYCEAVSEEVFSLRAARMFRRWRFEHRSVKGEPIDISE